MNREELQKFARTAFKMRQGFQWFLRFFSVFLFIIVVWLAVSFKLPWKATVALAIVPALGMVIPRKFLAWLWLAPSLAVIGVYIWIQLPSGSSGDWTVYQFAPNTENMIRVSVERNAATHYEQLLTDYGESVFGYQFLDETGQHFTFNQPWTANDFPQFTQWMTAFENGLENFERAANMKTCQFEVPVNQPAIDAQMLRLNRMKGWARLLLRSANRDLGESRFNRALKKQVAIVKMAQHLYNQNTLLDQSAAFDLELLASRTLETTIIDHCDDPNTLNTIRTTFAELDSGWAKSWPIIVERQKLLGKNIAALMYEVNPDGKTRISRKAMYALQEGLGYRPRRLFLKQHEMSRLAIVVLWLSLPTTPDGIAKVIDKRFDHHSLQTQKGSPPENIPLQRIWERGLNCKSAIDWFAAQQVKWFWALDGQDRRHDALISLIDIFAALKTYQLEHDRWPDRLDELTLHNPHALIDPVHGKPFVYQKTNTGFRLYSLGPNGTDDNGVNNRAEKKDDIMFWPRGPMDKAIEEAAKSEK